MRNRNGLVVAVGAVLSLVGVGIAVAYLHGSAASATSSRAVVVATADVAAGTPVAQARLAVRRVDTAAVPSDAVTDTTALAGQVALVTIGKNTVVTRGLFGTQGVAASGGVVLPVGRKGIGVELAFAPGGLRYVVPGNRIDVWASRRTGDGVATTKRIVTNVVVIATTPGAGNGAATQAQPGPGNLDFLLAVTDAQAEKIVGAQVGGDTLYFTLAGTRRGTS